MLSCIDVVERLASQGFFEAGDERGEACIEAILGYRARRVEFRDLRLGLDLGERGRLRVFYTGTELMMGMWPTPLLRVDCGGEEAWAKLEMFNPFSQSVKDRTAFGLLLGADAKRIVEVSSGNTALALTALSRPMGREVRIYLPRTADHVTALLRLMGAEVIVSDAESTVDVLYMLRHEVEQGAYHPDQFGNDMNFVIHLRTTAVELVEQLEAVGVRPRYVIGGLGTSGHLAAVGTVLRARYGARVVGVQPSDWIPGLRRVETGMKWASLVDEVVDVSLYDAVRGVAEFARRTGILVGPSSGAVYWACTRLVRGGGPYVLLMPDSLFKYTQLVARLASLANF